MHELRETTFPRNKKNIFKSSYLRFEKLPYQFFHAADEFLRYIIFENRILLRIRVPLVSLAHEKVKYSQVQLVRGCFIPHLTRLPSVVYSTGLPI